MEQQNPLVNRQQVFRGDDSAAMYYANYFGLLATKGDVRLRVGQVEEASAEKISVKVSADIYIAPEHFLDLVTLMVKKTREYPQLFPDTQWAAIAEKLQELMVEHVEAPTE